MAEVTKTELAQVNRLHLDYLEDALCREDLQVVGVDLLRAYGYDLIQLMNDVWLKERLT